MHGEGAGARAGGKSEEYRARNTGRKGTEDREGNGATWDMVRSSNTHTTGAKEERNEAQASPGTVFTENSPLHTEEIKPRF